MSKINDWLGLENERKVKKSIAQLRRILISIKSQEKTYKMV